MKNKLAIAKMGALLIVALVSRVQGAAQINWSNANSAGDGTTQTPGQDVLTYNVVSPTLLPTSSAYLLLLIQSTDAINDWSFASKNVSGNDTIVASVAWNGGAAYAAGAFFATVTTGISGINNGSFIYSVILNGASAGAATASAILDNTGSGVTTVAGIPGNGIYNYDTTGLASASPHDWVAAVPEPATFAFLGIGGLMLAIRRFRRA